MVLMVMRWFGHAYRYYNLALSISLAKIAGKAFRIGHLGDMNEFDDIDTNKWC